MNTRQLKGRAPFPFETIAVGVAFSPRLEMVLNEASRLSRTFKAELLLIHIGKRTSGKEKVLQDLCAKPAIGRQLKIIWKTGETVSTLLTTCKDNMVDLLILGALQQETMFRYYLGSVAGGLCRRAKCSLLLLTEPKLTGTRFRRIVVDCIEHPKTIHTLNTAFYFAQHTDAQEMRIVREVDQEGLAMAMSDDSTTQEHLSVKEQFIREAETTLQKLAAGCTTAGLTVLSKVLVGRQGFMIRGYTENCRADLLVIHSPDGRYGLMDRIFTHDMEYILEHLPCNMLIVHSRLADGA